MDGVQTYIADCGSGTLAIIQSDTGLDGIEGKLVEVIPLEPRILG